MQEIKADPELLRTQVYNYYKHKDDKLQNFCFESDYYKVSVNYVANGLNSDTLKEDLDELEELLDDKEFKTACIESEIRGKKLKVDKDSIIHRLTMTN